MPPGKVSPGKVSPGNLSLGKAYAGKNLIRTAVALGLAIMLSGCIIVPPGGGDYHRHHWHHWGY